MTPKELIDCSNRLIAERVHWDRIFSAIARLVLPMQDRGFNNGEPNPANRRAVEGWAEGPRSVDVFNERFDITALVNLERLATGIVSMVTPDSEKWQDIATTDEMGVTAKPDDMEARWLERQRDYLMNTRYNPLTGWSAANQAAIRSMCAFGTGLYLVEEVYGIRGASDVAVPWRCSPLPLSENYMTVDMAGMFDQDYRRFKLSARQIAGRRGWTPSAKTLEKANNPQKQHEMVEVLHYIGIRQELGAYADPMRASKVVSIYCEVDEKHVLSRSGFTYWPVIGYHWNQVPHSAYGESPVMLVMGEIKSANVYGKNTLLSTQQLAAPAIATFDDASTAKPNINPRAINYGAIDAQGRLKIQPILTAQNPSLINEVRAASKMDIKEGLYTNLWQILINNPQMSATEALIRANEKGELLGPTGTRIQIGLSMLTEAELTILEGKGAWLRGAVLEPPPSLAGKALRPTFNSPLDRLRRSSEVIGIQRTLEGMVPLVQMGRTDVLDKLDGDAILDIMQEVNGAPRRMFRKDDEVKAEREARAQQAQIAGAIETTRAAGEAGNEAISAIGMANAVAAGQTAGGQRAAA